MGLFKDMRDLKKQADEMTPPEHRGVTGGFRRMKEGVAQAKDVMGDMAAQQEIQQKLMASGVQGQATITAVRDTGMVVNENPRVEMDLQVQIEGRDPYVTTHQQIVPQMAIPQFQPGATLPVRVDPEDPNTLMFSA